MIALARLITTTRAGRWSHGVCGGVLRGTVTLLMLVMRCALAADIEPSIVMSTPTPKIYAGDQFIIDVEATAVDDEIDFDSLFESFTLQRQTHGTRIAVIGGKVVEIKIWRFETNATTVGEFKLGPLRVGDVVSNDLSTSVQAAPDVRWAPTTDDISLSIEWSKRNAYVQEQLLLTIRIDHLYPITKLELDEPEFPGFRVIELIKERRTEHESTTGRSFTFLKRYALFAQSSGNVKIPAFQATGEIIKSRLERATFDLSSQPVALNIRPTAPDYNASWWLPALEVNAYDEWERDQRWLQAGEQVRRTAIVEASGVSAEQLPDLTMPDARGIRISFIDSERETRIHDNGVSAIAKFNFMVRAISPTPVFFDPIEVNWWNTRQDKQATAWIKVGRIDIGLPNRDALLESVANSRQFTDTLSQWRRPLWLITAGLLALAALLNWPTLRGLVRHVPANVHAWWRLRRADRALRKASGGDDVTFLAALDRWKRASTDKSTGDCPMLDQYLESIYSNLGSAAPRSHDTRPIADALIAQRRQG